MKKNILIIFLLLGLLLPISVFADKNSGDHIPRLYDLPTEGVTYFLEYPNDIEVVLENYEDNMDERLELIYEGTSNENGESHCRKSSNKF